MSRGASPGRIDPLHGPRRSDREVSTEHAIKDKTDSRREWRDPGTGALSRASGPAVVYRDGSWEWWRDGLLHRDVGPAVYVSPGREEWVAPAGSGWGQAKETKLWFSDGQLHRTNGPAVVESGRGGAVEEGRHYYRRGQLHRIGGPAFLRHYEDDPSLEMWFRDGKLHREGGPAITFSDGREAWLREGRLHREGGPAIIVPPGVRGSFPIPDFDPAPAGSKLRYRDGLRDH